MFQSEGGSVDGARTNKSLTKIPFRKFKFLKSGCNEPIAGSNSYFGSRERSIRYCEWPHRGVARPRVGSLFLSKRTAFLPSSYTLRYSVITFIFIQHPTIDLPYRVPTGHCPASKQWLSSVKLPCASANYELQPLETEVY